ncbi:MAG: cytokine-induced anti-apoptosis inhibitor 1, Fe-S biogenesis-domain-containing protein [Monoraphidium minutum]|nr:MAG: cytokine-induced anti-apoptosis inhibitor 1, Fe-S biogenesis-domain-containing protein [Monoraphidium minutum]
MSRTLLATADAVLPVSALSGALTGADASTVDLLTGQASLEALLASGSKYSGAVVACGSGKASLAPAFLGGVAKLLQPGARATVQLGGGASTGDAKSALLLSGFVDCQDSGAAAVAGSVPSYGVGAKSALKKPAAAAAAAPAAPAVNGGAWKVDLAGGDEDEELVDEEELLTEEDRARPAPVAAADDCEVGAAGRKACKDCTCGRAEAEAAGVKVTLTDEMIQNPGVGSCGNCSLGDAFRCAGCPYRGLPSFQPGKPLTLPADFLVADA